jgi:Fe-S cluster biogenesis protein NfuA
MTAVDRGAAGAPPPTPEVIEEAIDLEVRRFINGHAGDVHVASVSPEGDVHLSFVGACARCPQITATFAVAVLPTIRRVPGVRNVTADGVHVSDAALRRVALLLGSSRVRTPG